MKEYLGDSVYADINSCGQLVLTTENGAGPSNTIYLEPEVYLALESYVERVMIEQRAVRAAAK